MMLNTLIYLMMALIPFIWSRQINGNYYNAKMFLIYLIGGLCLTQITFLKSSFQKIKLPLWVNISLLYFALYLLIQPILSTHYFFYWYVFKIVTFCSISYYFYKNDFYVQVLQNQYVKLLISVALMTLIGLHIYEIFDYRFIKDTLDHSHLLGTFGNVNMMAEFFILSLPLVFFWTKKPEFIHSLIKYLVLSLWVFIVLYTRSRSAWIGLGLFIFYVLFKQFNKKEFFAFVFGFTLYLLCIFLPVDQKSDIDLVKKSSFAERISLYQSARELMQDYPLGLGLGSFVNELIPYRLHQDFKPYEFEYADQPHSEILKWGVQFGWIGFILSLSVLIYIFIDLLRLNNLFLTSGFLAIIPQLFFQFPFENPAGIFLLSIYTGFWLKTKWTPESIQLNKYLKAFFTFCGLFAVVHSFIFITAIVIESQFDKDFEKTSLMCSVYPVNHRNCNFKNVLLLEKNETTRFRSELASELDFSYLTSDLQRILPIYFQHIKDEKHLCEDILIYKMMYPTQKFFNPQDIQICSRYPTPITYENPLQFKNDYRKWIESLIL